MKTVIIIMAFFSLNAQAMSNAEVSLDGSKFQTEKPTIDTSFAANTELGRAWIVLNMTASTSVNGDEASLPGETIKVKVDGLSLDPSSGNIVFGKDQDAVICATPKKHFLGRNTFYKNTQNCKIQVSLDTKKVDDGFALKKESVANIILDVARR